MQNETISEVDTASHEAADPRIDAACRAIAIAGGPAEFAKALSEYLLVFIGKKRIEQWRRRGIPDEWTTIVERFTDVPRQQLNPHLYDVEDAHRVIHRKLTSKS